MTTLFGSLLHVLFVRPIAVANRLMAPRTKREPKIERLNTYRTWAGFLGLALIIRANMNDPDLGGTLRSFLDGPYAKVVLAILCFVPAGVVLVAMAGQGQRARVAGAAMKPLLIGLSVTAAPLTILALAAWLFSNTSMTANDRLWSAIITVAALSLVPAALWALLLGVRFQFRAADVHPFLPAMVTGFVAVAAVVLNAVAVGDHGSPLDHWISGSGVFGGVVMLALSWYEISLLKSRGVRWDTHHAIGPNRHLLATDVHPNEWLPRLIVPLVLVIFGSSVHLIGSGAATSRTAAVFGAPSHPAGAVSSATHHLSRPTLRAAARPTPLLPQSIQAPSTAPDGHDAAGRPVSFRSMNLSDGRLDTAWRAAGDLTGRTIVLTFARPVTITSVGLVPGYAKNDPSTHEAWVTENRRIASVRWSAPGQPPVAQRFQPIPSIQSQAVHLTTRHLSVTITGITSPGSRDYTAISEIQVLGSN